MADVLGVDIGGSGIKAAPVDVTTGRMLAERVKLPTPHPSVPAQVAPVIRQLIDHFAWSGPIGITFPGVVSAGIVKTAANLDKSWISLDAPAFFGQAAGLLATVLNDADAAGLAEMRFGVGRDQQGTVLLLTLGTGIGSALFYNGVLIPNTEFGHIEIHGKDAEARASERAREEGDLTWEKWAGRVDTYLDRMEALLSPDLIIIGGGVSRKADKFLPLLTSRARVVPAALHNDAGIVGAAMAATAGGETAGGETAGGETAAGETTGGDSQPS